MTRSADRVLNSSSRLDRLIWSRSHFPVTRRLHCACRPTLVGPTWLHRTIESIVRHPSARQIHAQPARPTAQTQVGLGKVHRSAGKVPLGRRPLVPRCHDSVIRLDSSTRYTYPRPSPEPIHPDVAPSVPAIGLHHPHANLCAPQPVTRLSPASPDLGLSPRPHGHTRPIHDSAHLVAFLGFSDRPPHTKRTSAHTNAHRIPLPAVSPSLSPSVHRRVVSDHSFSPLFSTLTQPTGSAKSLFLTADHTRVHLIHQVFSGDYPLPR